MTNYCRNCKHIDFEIQSTRYVESVYLCKKRSTWNEKKKKWYPKEWMKPSGSCPQFEPSTGQVIEKEIIKEVPVEKIVEVEKIVYVNEGEKKYKCPLCGKEYNRKDYYKKHVAECEE